MSLKTIAPLDTDSAGSPRGLQLDRVSVAYGDHVAIQNISLAVEPGKTTAVIGPSGCGKSTTLKAVAGLNRVIRGSILLGSNDITEIPPSKRDIGLVPQSYAVFPHMSVESNIAYGLKARRVDTKRIKNRVAEILELTELTQYSERKPGTLSGGQRQRVALGRALAIDPEILLLDEPLAALDPQLRASLRRQLAEMLEAARCGTLLVTHDQHEALALADHIAVLKEGRLVQYGTPQELWDTPADAFVADFLASSYLFDVAIDEGEVIVFEGGWRIPLDDVIKVQAARQPQLLVRPTSLEIVDSDSKVAGAVDAVVTSLEYAGGRTLGVVRILEDHIAVSTQRSIQPGQTVRVRIKPGSTTLLGDW